MVNSTLINSYIFYLIICVLIIFTGFLLGAYYGKWKIYIKKCDGLNENGPMSSHIWIIVHSLRTLWEGLVGMVNIVEKSTSLWAGFEVSKDSQTSVCLSVSLSHACGTWCDLSAIPVSMPLLR